MAKNSNGPSATEICYPSPNVPQNKDQVNLSYPKSSSSGDPVAGSGKSGAVPVGNASTSPIRGDGYADGEFVARGSGRRGSVTYGKG